MQTLVNELSNDYDAFSILGKQTKTTYVTLTNDMVNITQPNDDSINHLGFVIKAIHDGINHEVFVDDVMGLTKADLKAMLMDESTIQSVGLQPMEETKLTFDKQRLDQHPLTIDAILQRLRAIMQQIDKKDQRIFYKVLRAGMRRIDAVYISKNRFLQQSYDFNPTMMMLMA